MKTEKTTDDSEMSPDEDTDDALIAANISAANIALVNVVRRALKLENEGKLNRYQSIHACLAADFIVKVGKLSTSSENEPEQER